MTLFAPSRLERVDNSSRVESTRANPRLVRLMMTTSKKPIKPNDVAMMMSKVAAKMIDVMQIIVPDALRSITRP
jgi:hypothetical protein